MMIMPIFCTIVTLQPVVRMSETRKKEKKRTARERNVQERELGGRELLNLYFLQSSYQLPLHMQL